MTVFRLTPLPRSPNRGRLLVPVAVAEATIAVLRRFGGPDGPHEGLVYWAGRRADRDLLVLTALVPASDHGPQRVMVPPGEVGRMARAARSHGTAIVAQVHSHPGDDTRHSDGDDHLVLMPTEGMFSLVVADYGHGAIHPSAGAGLHEYQDGRWVQIPPECRDALLIIPPVLPLSP
jgi:proteasome lid subunit RPN8/RPN11